MANTESTELAPNEPQGNDLEFEDEISVDTLQYPGPGIFSC